jgi:hypothetical protein
MEFALDERTKEVRCSIKCGDLDDEMQLPNAGLEKKAEGRDEFYKTKASR